MHTLYSVQQYTKLNHMDVSTVNIINMVVYVFSMYIMYPRLLYTNILCCTLRVPSIKKYI